MFFYYGGKRRIAKLYPPPSCPTIIEPFAGGAGYSLYHLGSIERVILYEKDERVVDTWERLLAMSHDELAAYPIPKAGERTSDFLVMTSAASNGIAHSSSMKVTDRQAAVFKGMLRSMLGVLEQAKAKVEIHQGDYRDAPDLEATWFIDPPYRVAPGPSRQSRSQGQGYRAGCDAASLDYDELAAWCVGRRGQKIVCEQEGADWLPFQPFGVTRNSMNGLSAEVAWIDPDYQLSLSVRRTA